MRKQRLRNTLAIGVLAASALTFIGCGGDSDQTSKSPAEESKAKITDLQAEYDKLQAQHDELSEEYFAASDEAFALREEAIDLITSGDLAAGNELEKKAAAVLDEVAPAHAEMWSLQAQMDDLNDQLERETTQLEANQGCDKVCRKGRDRMAGLATKCMLRLNNTAMPVSKIVRLCDKRFPVPQLEGE